jgi:3-hydroxyacyl-CoA dehydrogenase
LPERFIRGIDTFRAARPRKLGSPKLGISLRDWIIEAVQEKMERERKKYAK